MDVNGKSLSTIMSSPTGRIADPSDIVLSSDDLESSILFQLELMGRQHFHYRDSHPRTGVLSRMGSDLPQVSWVWSAINSETRM
jgi:hypothetical protein